MVVTSTELLTDAFDRARGVVHRAVDGLTPEQLAFRVDEANSIAWLVWHRLRQRFNAMHLAHQRERQVTILTLTLPCSAG
jgi:Protein of unknown function (DUF664)